MDKEQMIEQRATNIQATEGLHIKLCRRIARAELEREGRLLAGVDDCIGVVSRNMECWNTGHRCKVEMQQHRDRVRAAYEAEFAPPQRTVAQIMVDVSRNVVRVPQGDDKTLLAYTMVPTYLWDELSAALEREGGA